MNIALDTNRYSDLMRGVPEVLEVLQQADGIYMPFVVIAELRSGFLTGSKGRANEQILARFLARSDVVSVFADKTTCGIYAEMYQQLRRAGTPIPANDMWIAAMVLQHDLSLYARDAHFDRVPQLK